MPMRSQAQRKFLWMKDPKVAEKFEKETPKGAHLPKHKAKKKFKMAGGKGGY